VSELGSCDESVDGGHDDSVEGSGLCVARLARVMRDGEGTDGEGRTMKEGTMDRAGSPLLEREALVARPGDDSIEGAASGTELASDVSIALVPASLDGAGLKTRGA